jgi:hypothetical protein
LQEAIGEVLDRAGRDPRDGKFDDEFLLADQLDDLPAPEPLIQDVLSRHSYCILRGRDRSFKSFVALDWSLCMATGNPWQRKAIDRVRVLYVAGEGAHGIGERKRAWESACGLTVDPKWFVVRKSAVNLFRGGPEFEHGNRLYYGQIGIDTDAYEPKTGGRTLKVAESRWGPLPPTYRSSSRLEDEVSGIRVFRVPVGVFFRSVIQFKDLGIGDIEIIQPHHRVVIAWPSIHPDYAEVFVKPRIRGDGLRS